MCKQLIINVNFHLLFPDFYYTQKLMWLVSYLPAGGDYGHI